MKRMLIRWLPGLLLISALSSVAVWGITFPIRQSVDALATEVVELQRKEVDALQEVTQLQTAEAGKVALPKEALWSKGQSASIEVALQEALVSKASAAGLQLVSFGETTPPDDITHPALANELELVGTHDELAAFLGTVEDTSPALAVSYLWLRQLPPDPAQSGSPLSIRMTVWGFQAMEGAP